MKKWKIFIPTVLAASLFVACAKTPSKELSNASESDSNSLPSLAESTLPETPTTSDELTPTEPLPVEPEIPPTTPVEPPLPPPIETPTPPTAQYIKCTGDSVNIRAGASTDFSVLGSAEKGTMYAITGKSGGWYKTYYRGKTAYISASYASVFTLEKTENKAEAVIEEGYKLLGVPYVYGAIRFHDGSGKLLAGFSVQKFDCSSLIQYVFYKGAGKLLNLTTRTQVKQGKYVKRTDLQRGDCIFFTNEERQYKTGNERIGHVALYLGEGYILHTASDYARIEKMSTKRWGFYIEARRFL